MPLLTLVAKIETDAHAECIVKRAMWYATIILGDVTGIRERIDWGRRLNQRLHA